MEVLSWVFCLYLSTLYPVSSRSAWPTLPPQLLLKIAASRQRPSRRRLRVSVKLTQNFSYVDQPQLQCIRRNDLLPVFVGYYSSYNATNSLHSKLLILLLNWN